MSSSATLQTLSTVPAPSVSVSKGNGWKAGGAVIVFFLLWVFIWILFFSFRPNIVRYCDEDGYWPKSEGVCDNRPADPSRCLVASLVVTVIIFIIFWLIASAK